MDGKMEKAQKQDWLINKTNYFNMSTLLIYVSTD